MEFFGCVSLGADADIHDDNSSRNGGLRSPKPLGNQGDEILIPGIIEVSEEDLPKSPKVWGDLVLDDELMPTTQSGSAAIITSNNGAITIEDSEALRHSPDLNDVGSPKDGAKRIFSQDRIDTQQAAVKVPLTKKQKEIQTDVVTGEIMTLLFEELMTDGLVLRELVKLQLDLPRGIKTNIKAVKKYLGKICEFIVGTYLDKGVLYQLNCPLGPTPQERLRLFHSEADDENEDSSYAKISYEQVLDIDIYFDFEERLMDQEHAGAVEKATPPEVFQMEMEHIHNKLLFDCLNEALDACRVYGLKGQPLALRSRGKSFQKITGTEVPVLLTRAAQKVIEWSTFMCGFIPFKDDSFIQAPRALDEETLNQIKEDRLVRLLTEDVYENDDKWIHHEDEEIEIEVELSDILFENLITDVVECLLKIEQKKGLTITN